MLSPHPKPIPGFAVGAAVRLLTKNGWVIQRSFDSMASGRDLLDFRLYEVQRPTLLIWGDQDRLIPPSVGEGMQREIPGARLEMVPGCGHLAPSECSRPVIAATLKFLEAK